MRTIRSNTTWHKAVALAAISGLLMTACGGDDDNADDTTDQVADDTTSEPADDPADDPIDESTDTVQATQSEGLDSGLGSLGENRRVVFIADNPPSDSFWGTIQRGAQDAATLFNLDLDFQFTDGADIASYNELIGTSIATSPAGIAVVVRDPEALTENVCAADAAGIKVVSYNITQGGAVGDCMSGFIGQDFVAAGELVGSKMVELAGIGAGDLVLLPVEQPEASYATDRAAGVTAALDAVGAEYEVIQAGANGDAEALENMTQWLVGHPEVKAIIPLGGTPHRNAVQALNDAGLSPADVAVGGFDISEPVTDGIASGDILVAVTQEPYIQGFQAVAELALFIDFGIEPFSINTGAGLVDASNVAEVAALAGTIR
jgi:ABC-type sugar transport system substrate-binding protein